MVQRQAISPSLFYIFFFESYGHSLIRFPFDFLLINSATKGLSKGLSKGLWNKKGRDLSYRWNSFCFFCLCFQRYEGIPKGKEKLRIWNSVKSIRPLVSGGRRLR